MPTTYVVETQTPPNLDGRLDDAAWSLGVPREVSAAFAKMRWDVSIPAFSNCSLDNNPGNGEVTADKWGLVTVKAVKVNKGRNRIVISKP